MIVGAGISGVGGAYHLTKQCPGKSFVVLEALESFGGTWLTHRYPGIRSDSDLYTFGYRSSRGPVRRSRPRPRSAPTWARSSTRTTSAGTSATGTRSPRRTLVERDESAGRSRRTRTDTGEAVRFTANFLWMCQGYYRHSEGYTPEWPGMDTFKGRIVHPQTWPEDLDYKDKNVIVIGSGATAATLVPAIAADCAHVTVLQRSPTYFFPARNDNELADTLRELEIDEEWIHEIVRRKILHDQARLHAALVRASRRSSSRSCWPASRAYLGPDYDIETHFTPNYRPWRQRIAFVPDGDLFAGDQLAARHRWSPTRSTASPRRASC